MITRRQAVASLAAATLTSCARKPATGTAPHVSIVRVRSYGQDLYDTVCRLLVEHHVNVRGKRVLLKPNLVEFDADVPINTNPLVVHAAFEAFKALGAAEVRIGEGPGHRRETLDLAEAAGYFKTIPRFEEVFTDLNTDELTKVSVPSAVSKLNSLYLPNTTIACDLLVSLPKMKTHHWVGATLGMKNLFGLVPGGVYGWPKNVLHWAGIHESIADLHKIFPRQFCLVDGIDAMEGNGPIQGTLKPARVLVAGANVVAVDATCCRIMGIDPRKVRYLELASPGEVDESNIRQIAEPVRAVRSDFALIPQLSNMRLGAI